MFLSCIILRPTSLWRFIWSFSLMGFELVFYIAWLSQKGCCKIFFYSRGLIGALYSLIQKNGYTFATVYTSKCVFLNQTLSYVSHICPHLTTLGFKSYFHMLHLWSKRNLLNTCLRIRNQRKPWYCLNPLCSLFLLRNPNQTN